MFNFFESVIAARATQTPNAKALNPKALKPPERARKSRKLEDLSPSSASTAR